MQHLHSYWRMDYVEAPRVPEEESPFRALIEGGDDRKALIVHRSTHSCLMLNRYPYNAGHLLVLPYREVGDLTDLSVEERSDLIELTTTGRVLLEKAIHPEGFNIGLNLGEAGGAGIPRHLHFHIVPRWKKDCNFMPVLADTSVLPIALEELWERLRRAVNEVTGENR